MESRKDGNVLLFDEGKHRYTLNGDRVPGTTTFGKGGYPTSEQLIGWQIAQGAMYAVKVVQRLRRDKPGRVVGGELLDRIAKKSKKAYLHESKRAAGIGTVVHDYAYLVKLGRVREALQMLSKYEDSPNWAEINNGVREFDAWHAQNKGEIVLLEAIVASVRHQFGGKFDHLSVRDGVLVLSDYKTSNGIYVDQFIQLAAYAIAIEEWLDKWLAEYGLPLKVGGLEILRFGKDGRSESRIITDPAEIEELKAQAVRCRDTYRFRLKWENDKRFKYMGGAGETGGNSKAAEQGLKPLPRKQRNKDSAG